MQERSLLHTRFADLYAFNRIDGPAKPVSETALDQVEAALDTFLPVAYRRFMITNGPLFVPELWDAIVEREPGRHPVREFLTPEGIIADNPPMWAGGMPERFIGVAGDFMGGLFGFEKTPTQGDRPDDLRVKRFDADYCKIVRVASSFDEWLAWFVDNIGKIN